MQKHKSRTNPGSPALGGLRSRALTTALALGILSVPSLAVVPGEQPPVQVEESSAPQAARGPLGATLFSRSLYALTLFAAFLQAPDRVTAQAPGVVPVGDPLPEGEPLEAVAFEPLALVFGNPEGPNAASHLLGSSESGREGQPYHELALDFGTPEGRHAFEAPLMESCLPQGFAAPDGPGGAGHVLLNNVKDLKTYAHRLAPHLSGMALGDRQPEEVSRHLQPPPPAAAGGVREEERPLAPHP